MNQIRDLLLDRQAREDGKVLEDVFVAPTFEGNGVTRDLSTERQLHEDGNKLEYESLRPRWRVRRRSGPQMWRQHAQRGRVRRRSGPQMWRQHARPLRPRWRARRHSGPQMWRQHAPRRQQLEASALQACPQRGPILEKTILATLAILAMRYHLHCCSWRGRPQS